MTANYIQPAHCLRCTDLDFEPDCVLCTKIRTRQVEILQIGVGFFGNKAVIKDLETGDLNTVYLSDLKGVRDN